MLAQSQLVAIVLRASTHAIMASSLSSQDALAHAKGAFVGGLVGTLISYPFGMNFVDNQ